MSEERRVAAAKGYESPVWETIQDTHTAYNQNMIHILSKFDKE